MGPDGYFWTAVGYVFLVAVLLKIRYYIDNRE